MNFDIKYLEKLAKIIKENNLNEITLEDEERIVSLKRETTSQMVQIPLSEVKTSQVISSPVTSPKEVKQDISHRGKPVIAPMVGTFYASPSPNEQPFVKVGDSVSAGQIICIIEAMKLMNEIETDVSGRITEICVKNGDNVEFGQVLMYVEN